MGWLIQSSFFKNDKFGTIDTHICEMQTFDLNRIIHHAAQDGKNMFDKNFSKEKRQSIISVHHR